MINNSYLSEYLKRKFGGKIAKISIDGGFTCPNRENGNVGCLFCSDSGAGEFSGNSQMSITEQIKNGKTNMDRKWNNSGYIAYFQNFTNTYDKVEKLRRIYEEAISCEGIIGLAIATRPDCLEDDILDLLANFNKKTFLWIELGFQTSNDLTSELINRGYKNKILDSAINNLHKRNIKTVVHLIGGLPGESKYNFLESVKYVNRLRPWGIKLHSIYIQSNSPLNIYSIKNNFEPLGMYEYIDWVTDALIILNKEIIIHRITGDPDKRLLVQPVWQKDKLRVLSEIKRIYKEKSEL